jgi:polysaccharide biosynthesis/export protein
LAETVIAPDEIESALSGGLLAGVPSTSLAALWIILVRNRRLFLGVVGVLVAACLIYWLAAPNEYEATAKVELRSAPDSLLASDRREAAPPGSFASGQVQLETLANVLKSEQLAWDVITRLGLYKERGFSRNFEQKFPGFNQHRASADAKEYLLREFREKLTVESLPHTLVLAIRFRSHDAALSATVVNELIEAFGRQETGLRFQSTQSRREWLNAQLDALKSRVVQGDARLAEFQRVHGILTTSETEGGRLPELGPNDSATTIEALSRELVNATADRILREAEYRAATSSDPELVFSTDRRSGSAGNPESALLQQLHTRRSELEMEQTQLGIEHGLNFPRLVEIRKQLQDTRRQIGEVDERLVRSFRSAWKTAVNREAMVRKSLDAATVAGLKLSGASLTYASMWQEANASRAVYVKLLQESEEAAVAAGSRGSAMSVIDYARQPAKPASPNLPVDMAITVFIGLWLGLAVVLGKEAHWKSRTIAASLMACMALGASISYSQAPIPSTSGLPTGVARIPQTGELKSVPSAQDAPAVWNSGRTASWAGAPPGTSMPTHVMEAPIGAGDMLEVTEAHGVEMRTIARVSQAGTVVLPLVGEVKLEGMDERSAAHAIEAALIEKGMLLHPQVTVLVTAYAGQDVSVLGEVTRPGVYSYTTHHRLLDLISAASGLNQNAGRLVTISRRNDPEKTLAVALDPAGMDSGGNHNPELLPGDTVQVGRAGLIYVVGDVIRPGGFPVDPVQAITVVQAVSLAWGPAQNAALKKAVLIREQPGGRTVTTLNLKRMLRGLDPDLPVRDRDILFVPDSMAKNLLNRSMESVIQSVAGVSIYSGLVYSQRF